MYTKILKAFYMPSVHFPTFSTPRELLVPRVALSCAPCSKGRLQVGVVAICLSCWCHVQPAIQVNDCMCHLSVHERPTYSLNMKLLCTENKLDVHTLVNIDAQKHQRLQEYCCVQSFFPMAGYTQHLWLPRHRKALGNM